MTTLVVCLDRSDDVGRKTGLRSPIVGWEAVRALVTDIGLADPEDSGVNSLLETLRVAQDLRDENEEAVVAVVSGDRESMVSADRAVARQLEDLMAEYNPDSAVVVIDSAEDERLVPIVESRVQVDSVDRVVVRQARDIESTYYLLKQFLADEELRQTVLVPLGLTLLVFPFLAMQVGTAEGAAAITTVIGLFLLYKGFSIDEIVTGFAHQARESLYSGQVSVVTYVVAAGLTLVGLFAGALGLSNLGETQGVVVPATQFAFDSVPWFAMAALTASAGRLLDEAIGEEPIRRSYLNLPFIVLAVGLVIRGFSAYFLQQQGVIGPIVVPAIEQGVLSIDTFTVAAGERLTLYVVSAIVVSLVGARIAATVSGADEDSIVEDGGDGSPPSDSSSSASAASSSAELTDGGPSSGPAESGAPSAFTPESGSAPASSDPADDAGPDQIDERVDTDETVADDGKDADADVDVSALDPSAEREHEHGPGSESESESESDPEIESDAESTASADDDPDSP